MVLQSVDRQSLFRVVSPHQRLEVALTLGVNNKQNFPVSSDASEYEQLEIYRSIPACASDT